MLTLSLLAASLSLVGQTSSQLPEHTNQEIVVKVVDERTNTLIDNATLEWIDLSTKRTIPVNVTTGNDGLAIIPLEGRRYLLRARGSDGRESAPEHVPGHEIVLKVVTPPPLPSSTALQPIPATGCEGSPVQGTCGCAGVEWQVCEPGEDVQCCVDDCECNCGPCFGCGCCCGVDGPCVICSANNNTFADVGTATFDISVPENAVVFVNGRQTTSTGVHRRYVSFGLKAGERYIYVLRVEVLRDGKVIDDSRELAVRANERKNIAFDSLTPSQFASAR